ncbi:MAG: ROK family glucokinase [Candidatus Omnitrophota bacterium]
MFSIGIDLGGTNIAAGIVDEKGVLIAKESVPTFAARDYSLIIKDMAEVAIKACKKANLTIGDMAGIGIGSPGIVDSKNGVIVYTCNINFDHTPMREELRKYIDLPVFISNDANCAALGETADTGAACGFRNVIMVTLGTGVGGGIIIDGKIYEGDHSAGAEIGHSMLVVDGVPCNCGRNGCWESYSSATALIRETKEAIEKDRDTVMWDMIGHDYTKISGRTAFDASRKGDRVAQQVVDFYIKYLSEGLIDMINIFRPEIILLGGGVSNEGDYLFDPVRAYVKKYEYGGNRIPTPVIRKAALGNDAGIIGAAMLVFRQ